MRVAMQRRAAQERTERDGGRERKGEVWDEEDEVRGRLDGDEATVCAWWTGYGAQHEKGHGEQSLAHVYLTKMRPTKPLEEGRKVKILALPATRRLVPDANVNHYDLYDPHVRGEVIKIIRTRAGWARATVINECRGNAVGIIDLDIPDIPGVTVYGAKGEMPARVPTGLGEVPEGMSEWRGSAGGSACHGAGCGLKPGKSRGTRSFRAFSKQGRSQTTTGRINEPQSEGVYALHYWLKYEGYE